MKTFISTVPNLMWNWNNRVVFVVHCTWHPWVFRNPDNKVIGWLFSDDDNHPRVGTTSEGQAFIERCAEVGLTVAHVSNLAVPFSSGPRRRGEHAGQYTPDEYGRVWQDLPTPEELAKQAPPIEACKQTS